MLTTSGTKPLWQRDKAGAKVFLAEKKQALKIDAMTPQYDHTLPLREHFHSNLRRHTSEAIIPEYICLLWWRAVILEREMCYCELNPLRSLLSLSGKTCSDTAMGGSINFWNSESCAQECWLSLLTWQLCCACASSPQPSWAAGHSERVQQFCCTLPPLERRAGWEGDVMDDSHFSHFPDWQNGTVKSFFCPVWHSQKELNNLVPPQTVPPDNIQKHSLIYCFRFLLEKEQWDNYIYIIFYKGYTGLFR